MKRNTRDLRFPGLLACLRVLVVHIFTGIMCDVSIHGIVIIEKLCCCRGERKGDFPEAGLAKYCLIVCAASHVAVVVAVVVAVAQARSTQ
jgi:hypothetical protein